MKDVALLLQRQVRKNCQIHIQIIPNERERKKTTTSVVAIAEVLLVFDWLIPPDQC